jgi:hypothetical protein
MDFKDSFLYLHALKEKHDITPGIEKNFVVKVRKDDWYSTNPRHKFTPETIGQVLTDFESTGEVQCWRKYTNSSNTQLSGQIKCNKIGQIKRNGNFKNIEGEMFLVLFQDKNQFNQIEDDIQFGIQYTATNNEVRVEPCYLEANIIKNSSAAIGNLFAYNAGGRRSSRKHKSRIHAGVLRSRKRRKSGRKKHRSKNSRRT